MAAFVRRLGVLNTAGELSVKEGPLDAGWTFESAQAR